MRGKFLKFLSLCIGGVLCLPFQTIHAGNLKIRRHNSFISFINYHPGLSTSNLVILRGAIGSDIILIDSDGSPINEVTDFEEEALPASLTMPALFYPNPFRLEEGAILGYRLSRGDMDISIRMYDMRGNQIFRKDCKAGEQGGLLGYNKVPFNRSVLGHKNLPSGIYMYVLIYNGKVIGKGKVAVKP